MEDLRYPIGKYSPPEQISANHISEWKDEIRKFPAMLRAAVQGLTEVQLDTPYRPEGWTVRQVVHHVSDSHLNSIIRFKWGLTEDEPLIKAYDQKGWANTGDVQLTPLVVTLAFIEALHAKWVHLLDSIQGDDWKKGIMHPETGKRLELDWLLGMYAWHGKHHLAHITGLIEREGWS